MSDLAGKHVEDYPVQSIVDIEKHICAKFKHFGPSRSGDIEESVGDKFSDARRSQDAGGASE